MGARGIQSLETGLNILYAVAKNEGPAALSAIAKQVDMPASQTHRYLASLIAAGVVKQNEATGRYDLDSGAMRLGLTALSRLDIFREADVVFSELAKSTGVTSLISIWGDFGPTIIRWYPGNPPVITPLHIGSTMPLLRSAAGRVFFSFGHQAVMDAAARREIKNTRMQIDLKDLRSSIQKDRGAAIDSVLIPGLRAVSAPIFDLQGHLSLVATSVAVASGVGQMENKAMTEALHASCRKVTEAIGGRWFS